MLCAGVLLQSGAGSFTHYVHSLEERQCFALQQDFCLLPILQRRDAPWLRGPTS